MNYPNEKRNRKIVLLRFGDPQTYSYAKIGKEFTPPLKKQTVQEICQRDWEKFLTKAQLKLRPRP